MSQQKESLLQYQQPTEVYGADSLSGSRPKNVNQMFDSKLAIDCMLCANNRIIKLDVPPGPLRCRRQGIQENNQH